MKKSFILLIVLLVIFFSNICSAAEVPLTNKFKIDQFMTYFNQTAEANNMPSRIISKAQTDYSHNNEKSFVFQLNTNIPRNFFIVFTDAYGNILEIFTYTTNGDESMRSFIAQNLTLQRTLAAPTGSETVDGMYALLDAMKTGYGTYWSNYTNRRYLIRRQIKDNVTQFYLRAVSDK